MKIFHTEALPELNKAETLYVYNGLDTAITCEVFDGLRESLTPEALKTYQFVQSVSAPALEMMLRGMRINDNIKNELIYELEAKQKKVQYVLNKLSIGCSGTLLNPNSPKQLIAFFYTFLGLPEEFKFEKGKKVKTTNREALEKLSIYLHARPFINCILKLRDLTKLLGALKYGVDEDRRMRFGFNVCGTETGRWSSSKNIFDRGANYQNLTNDVKRIFCADAGYKLAYIDLEQAESRGVGILAWAISNLSNYLDACESEDLHTTVCRMVWQQDLPWTGDIFKDKKLAGALYYRQFSYRDMAKRGGHGTNYYGLPSSMANILKVSSRVMENFQRAYFEAFPEIPLWHQNVAFKLQTERSLITPFSRKRHFFGRPGDDTTLREAIAHNPQSLVADYLNTQLHMAWKLEPDYTINSLPAFQLLGQVHDAIVIQYQESHEAEILQTLLDLFKTLSIPVRSEITSEVRDFQIPNSVEVGWTWAKLNKKEPGDNPDGLIEYNGFDRRNRTEFPPTGLLDREVSRVHRRHSLT